MIGTLKAGIVIHLAFAGFLCAQVVSIDTEIPTYARVSGVSGTLTSVGSDTLSNLMTLWGEDFSRFYPSVVPEIEGKGSQTAPPALIKGLAQLGPMSRKMKKSEVDAFEKKFGYKPIEVPVAVDGLALYVHKDNPLEHLTLPQVDAIFSKNRLGRARESIQRWGQLGLTGAWAERPISLYGRNSASGTYGFFKDKALFKGDYRDEVKEQPGSASVVQGIAEDRSGIGYSGIGYKTSSVRVLALAKEEGKPIVAPEPEHVVTGRYPLARYLYVYVNKSPSRPLSPLVHEFLTFVLSQQGQQVVVKDGYLPLPAPVVKKALKLFAHQG